MRAIFGSYLWVKVSDESRPYARTISDIDFAQPRIIIFPCSKS